ncbi:hypothetical protein U1872_08075 [Sphingomonas sp. RB3P16]|uniref:hypothetical protein n=1 Tax=Parasphingomonas frigoris TaxID=3096163 RepID=UPI002FCCA391
MVGQLYPGATACDLFDMTQRKRTLKRKIAGLVPLVALTFASFGALALIERASVVMAWMIAVACALGLTLYLLLSRQSE